MVKVPRIPLVALAALALMAGCGGDDNNGGTNPGGQTDQFQESVAVAQSQAAVPLALNMVQSMTAFAQSTPGKDGTFGYDESSHSWVSDYTYANEGYSYTFHYVVQYLDSANLPQQYPADASSMAYSYAGTGHYTSNSNGTQVTVDNTYHADVTLQGLGSSTLTMAGSGGFGIDETVVSGGNHYDYNYDVSWVTGTGGITLPIGGCPTGTFHYTLAPYHLDIVFDGTNVATHTLTDGSGAVVAAGTGTDTMSCGN